MSRVKRDGPLMVQVGNTSCRYCTWVRYCSGIFVWWGRWDRFESEEGLRVDDIARGGWMDGEFERVRATN
jgi:hypothetical protein